ncbi:P-loop containing nucleoside triphosphate hydrolase protein [Wallemia mellicola]|nr:P-loop containing nucleoside triphosphate hydrolase protein [Wallemia mellicola]
MPPKKGGKKSKKTEDDDFWATAGESIPANDTAEVSSEEDAPPPPKKSAFSAFSAMDVEGGDSDENDESDDQIKPSPAVPDEDDDDDGGDLMAAISKSAKNKKNKNKNKKQQQPADEDDEDALLAAAMEKNANVTPKDEPKAAPQPPAEDDGAPRLLSKKEKEKLKKEKEKAKKKAQAANKKTAQPQKEESPAQEEAPEPAEPTDAPAEDEPEEAGASAADKKKKKKKKGGAADKPEPEPKATDKKKGAKKPPAGLAALRAQLEANKQKEEEEKRRKEEEKRRIEEEERLAIEAELYEEEQKQLKKEKDKAKREQLKKEGKWLTDKQKKERAAGEARRQALLSSGVRVAGLEEGGDNKPKKPIYGKKPAKGKQQPQQQQPKPVEQKPVEAPKPEPAPAKEEEKEDRWDATSSEDEGKDDKQEESKAPTAGDPHLDDWDASSDEEEKKPAPAAAKETKKEAPKSAETKEAAKPAGKPAAKKAQESSSEEDSSEEDSDDDSEDSSDDEELTSTQKEALKRKAEAHERRIKRHEKALAARSKDNLRSPICCILGHVDTGKTKLLDKIRQTNVQEGEAGGITQQIGATYFPIENIKKKVAVLDKEGKQEYKLPGLLVIDTPGHESFTNLRSRGSSLCNIAVLVVDIMHGLEPQTLESLRLLRDKKTPFIVALNKIDRLYGWKTIPNNAFLDSLAQQSEAVRKEFHMRLDRVNLEFAEQGLNSCVYYDNKKMGKVVSLVPTSAFTGEGVPDLLQLLINLTQERMSGSLMYLSELECTVLEVKVIEGLGTTIDVVLSNGILREGDKIVVCGLNGPIVTQVRALLTPQPMKEMRIKGAYVHHKEIKASMGVKITAPDLEKAIAGSRLMVVGEDDDEEELMEEVMGDLQTLLSSIDKSGRGVCVQASTLGSLEALLDFLRASEIPVSGINIGPVYRKDVLRAGVMIEKAKEFATILAFDVPVDKEAEKYADEVGVKIFKADIIYHLFDQFTAYNKSIVEEKRKEAAPAAVWPCRLKILQAFVRRDPIIVGCDIVDGTLRVGTPICVATVNGEGKKEIVNLGRVGSIEINHKPLDIVKKNQTGAGIAVKIDNPHNQAPKMVGRHFQESDLLLSHISRKSIDVLKENFRNDLTKEDLHLIKRLKQTLDIP